MFVCVAKRLPLLQFLTLFALVVLWNGAALCSAQVMSKPQHSIPSLHQFQQLNVDHLRHELRDGDRTHADHRREIKLKLFDRDLHLRLAVHKSLFHHKFSAYEVDGMNRKRRRSLNKAAFYHGVVHGVDKSRVVAHVNEDNVVTASIHLPEDTYSIEPSKRHIKEAHDFHMIAYRDADVKSKKSAKACGLRPEDEGKEDFISQSHDLLSTPSKWWQFGGLWSRDNASVEESDSQFSHRRLKRQAVTGGIACPVSLVADSFYSRSIGNEDFQTTASSMIQQLNFADTVVFTETRFIARDGSAIEGAYGMQVRDVIVHTQPTANGSVPYNTGQKMTVRNLLTALTSGDWNTSRRTDMPGVCLAHLFTHQGFSGNVLGLAYVASPDRNSVGGVCSRVFRSNRWLNVGLTTTQHCPTGDLSSTCQTLIQREADLVTAHELGHNWGSQHDSTAACTSDANGRFLMNTYALPGTEANNNNFSSCSISSIGAVIVGKQALCFIPRSGSFCGNGLLEPRNEQCDAGFGNTNDPCCSADCRFKNSTFQCSDANTVCCANCMYAPATKLCQEESLEHDISCRANSTCSGTNTTCLVQFKTSGRCGNFGQCRKATNDRDRCQGFCEANNQISCICPEIDHQCVVCCKTQNTGAQCTPGRNGSLRVQNGAGCGIGFCLQGICERAVLDSTEKLFGFLSDFSADTIARWFRNNIVAAVLVCTFIAWIIGGCVVHHVDKRKWRKFNSDFDAYKQKFEEYIGAQSVTPRMLNRRRSRRQHSSQSLRPENRSPGHELSPLMEDAMMH